MMIRERRASTWQWSPGVDFIHDDASLGWGLALSIERRAQRPNLFSDTLRRRFEGLESYDGFYVCLDSQQRFVVWHELDVEDRSDNRLQGLLDKLLVLAGFRC